MISIHTDFTDKTEAVVAAAFDLASTGMLVVDTDGRLVAINRAARALLGLEAGSWEGEKLADLAGHGIPGIDLSPISGAAWDSGLRELLLQRPNGSRLCVRVRITTILAAGKPYRLVTLINHHSRNEDHGRLSYLASHDPLTGCLNRRGMAQCLERLLANARDRGEPLAVIFIDLDGFKSINDCYGHEAGDQVLVTVASRLQRCLRKNDRIVRLGGDEFVILTSQAPGREDAAQIAERLLGTLTPGVKLQGRSLLVGMSMGISFYPHDGEDGPRLISRADQAMYHAKMAGKNRYAFAQTLPGEVTPTIQIV